MNDEHRSAPGKPLPRLSVVIPCRNEERHIIRCLESVLRETTAAGGGEVIVVDSASTDGTVAVVQRFPVSLICLPATWPLSPAAGRFIGCSRARGAYLFVIDADLELLPGFLRPALAFLEKNPRVAGVAGMGREIYDDGGRLDDLYGRRWRQHPVSFLGGAALYRAEVLRRVGNFNPFLKAEEEAELAQRIRRAGFLLYSLALPMTEHLTSRSFESFIRRWRAGMFHGIGQMLRLSCQQRTCSAALVVRFRQFIGFLGIMAAGLAAVAALLITRRTEFIVVLLTGTVAAWGLLVICRGGIVRGTQQVLKYILINTAILAGLGKKTPAASSYPQDAVMVAANTGEKNTHAA